MKLESHETCEHNAFMLHLYRGRLACVEDLCLAYVKCSTAGSISPRLTSLSRTYMRDVSPPNDYVSMITTTRCDSRRGVGGWLSHKRCPSIIRNSQICHFSNSHAPRCLSEPKRLSPAGSPLHHQHRRHYYCAYVCSFYCRWDAAACRMRDVSALRAYAQHSAQFNV